MSSSSIRAEIVNCQNRISQKEIEMANIKQKIQSQEYVKSGFFAKKSDFMAEQKEKTVQETALNNYSNATVLTYRFHGKSDPYISSTRNQLLEENLSSIETKMQNELNKHKQELSALESQLSGEKLSLEQLNVDYGRALAAEESERQAAAVAAQTNKPNSGGTK